MIVLQGANFVCPISCSNAFNDCATAEIERAFAMSDFFKADASLPIAPKLASADCVKQCFFKIFAPSTMYAVFKLRSYM